MNTAVLLGGLADGVGAGIFLPTSILTSAWFQVLAAFVAVNTLAYATLSVAKLVPRRRRRR
jgi:hypothetical protein